MNLLLRTIAPIIAGVLLGSLMGYFVQCTSGTCPLTSTWWRGALYGGAIGVLFAINSRSS